MDESCVKCGTMFSASDFYIICGDCYPVRITLCLLCFAKGTDLQRHKADHAYHIMRLDFPLWCSDWNASEEFALLEAIRVHGLGNWPDVSVFVHSKSAAECEEHYMTLYMDGKVAGSTGLSEGPPERTTQRKPLESIDESLSSDELGGYNPLREEYSTVWNPKADRMVSNLQAQDSLSNIISKDSIFLPSQHVDQNVLPGSNSQLLIKQESPSFNDLWNSKGSVPSVDADHLKIEPETERKSLGATSVDKEECEELEEEQHSCWSHLEENLYQTMKEEIPLVYNGVLEQRELRESVAKKLKLWDGCSIQEHHRLLEVLPPGSEKLLPFLRFLTSSKIRPFIKGLYDLHYLRREVRSLQRARSLGIRHLEGLVLESRLRQRRERRLPRVGRYLQEALARLEKQSEEVDVDKLNALASVILRNPDTKGLAAKREPQPLSVEHMEGCEKLSEEEVELCSTLRLAPLDYLQHKQLLISESQASGEVRLVQARNLLKIDVNKTRRMFDFLCRKKIINARHQASFS